MKELFSYVVRWMKHTWPIWSGVLLLLGLLGIGEHIIFEPPRREMALLVLRILLYLGMFASSVYVYVQRERLQTEVDAFQADPFFYPRIYGLPLQAIALQLTDETLAEVENPVQLKLVRSAVKIGDNGRDGSVVVHFAGVNIGDEPLSEIYYSFGGSVPASLGKLHPRVFDLSGDQKAKGIPPAPAAPDANKALKFLELPFRSPGIEPKKDFVLEFHYQWPDLFSPGPGYWYFWNTSLKGQTESLALEIDFGKFEVDRVELYILDLSKSRYPKRLGSVSAKKGRPRHYVEEVPHPNRDAFYILAFDRLRPKE